MAMTRKDFERIAQVFRVNAPSNVGAQQTWAFMLDDMCIELQAMNPRFDEARFRAACEKGQ